MTRPSIQIVFFLVLLNASAGLITASGVGAALDINPELGGDDKIQEAQSNVSEIAPNQGRLDTLFALFTSTTDTMKHIIKLMFYGPTMLMNLGVPNWIVTFIGAPLAFIWAIDVVHYLSGRG